MFPVKNELIIPFPCPECGETILWDIDTGTGPVKCPKCHAFVEVPASAQRDAVSFKAADNQRKK